MDTPQDHLTSDIPNLAGLLQRAREAVQRNLVAGTSDRADQERRIRETREEAARRAEQFVPDQAQLDRFASVLVEAQGVHERHQVAQPESVEEAQRRWNEAARRCGERAQSFHSALAEHRARMQKVFARKTDPPSLPADFGQDVATMRAILDSLPSLQKTEAARDAERSLVRINDESRARSAAREAELQVELSDIEAEISAAVTSLGGVSLDWPAFLAAERPSPTWVDARTRIGTFADPFPGPGMDSVPCVISFPLARSLAIEAPAQRRDSALSLARSVVLRVLANTPPGRTEVTFIDPVAIGGSVADFLHLGDFDPKLVDTRPLTSQQAIETRLAEHAAHVETVISKYLRGQFQSLGAYNQAAGEMAESLRLLVVLDFPTQFSDRAAEQLLSVIENGPRCGVVTMLVFDPAREPSHALSYERLLASMDVLRWNGTNLTVDVGGERLPFAVAPDVCPPLTFDAGGQPQTPAARLLTTIGAAARKTEDAVVDFERTFTVLGGLIDGGLAARVPVLDSPTGRIHPNQQDTWWSGSTTTGASAPIGRSGSQDIATLYFSSTDIAGGAIMVGLPRSGKTTSLHAAILSLCMIYGPEELELYLIDAKHGVEFNSYRELPHARMVAINREREFAVAVLKSLDQEIERRAELMKREAPGRTNIEEYRTATGERLPRIVAFIDEFHEIFEEDDRLGQAAFDAFSNIVRQGPFAGVHLVLASQTLSSMPAMDRSTLMLLPTRVAFPCNESDAEIVMGDDNREARFLERAGDGLLNSNRGNPQQNQRFRGVYITPDDRAALVNSLVAKASHEGFERRPKVFDGDALATRDSLDAREFFTSSDGRQNRLNCLVGESLSLDPQLRLTLRRDQEANLLIIASADDEGLPAAEGIGVLHSVLLAASSQASRVEVLDFLNDEGHPGTLNLEALCERLPANYGRRRRAAAVVREVGALVAERSALDDFKSPAVVLAISGIGRANDLDPDEYSYDEEDSEPLAATLQRILRDGPDVGIHCVVMAESASALHRRLGPASLDYFGLRVAGQLRGDAERQSILEDFRGIEIRGSQLVLFDRRTERRTKFHPFGPVTSDWLELASLERRLHAHEQQEGPSSYE